MYRHKLLIALCVAGVLLLSVHDRTSAHADCDRNGDGVLSTAEKGDKGLGTKWRTTRKSTGTAWIYADEVRAYVQYTQTNVTNPVGSAPAFAQQSLWARTNEYAVDDRNWAYWIEVGTTKINYVPGDPRPVYEGFFFARNAPGQGYEEFLLSGNPGVYGAAHKYNVTWTGSGYDVKIDNVVKIHAAYNGRKISEMQTGVESADCYGVEGMMRVNYTSAFSWAWWGSDGVGINVTLTNSDNDESGHSYNYVYADIDYACGYINYANTTSGC